MARTQTAPMVHVEDGEVEGVVDGMSGPLCCWLLLAGWRCREGEESRVG